VAIEAFVVSASTDTSSSPTTIPDTVTSVAAAVPSVIVTFEKPPASLVLRTDEACKLLDPWATISVLTVLKYYLANCGTLDLDPAHDLLDLIGSGWCGQSPTSSCDRIQINLITYIARVGIQASHFLDICRQGCGATCVNLGGYELGWLAIGVCLLDGEHVVGSIIACDV